MKFILKYISPLLCICLIACEPGSESADFGVAEPALPATVPTHEIQLVEEAIFGDSEDQLLMFWFTQPIIADDSNRVYFADMRRTVQVYNPDGSYLTSIGRRGNGPGEFQNVSLFFLQNNQLYVYGAEERMTSFSLETYEYVDMVRTIPLNRGNWPDVRSSTGATPVFVREDGTFLVQMSKVRNIAWEIDNPDIVGFSQIYSLSADGSRLTDMLLHQDMHAIFEYRVSPQYAPYESRQLLHVSEQGNIYSVPFTDEFHIEVYDSNGDSVRTIQHDFENRELTRDEIEQFTTDENKRDQFNRVDLPDVWPVMNELVVDDEGRLWVSTFVEDDEVYEWWVLQEDGEVTARFTWPRDQEIDYIKNGYLYSFDDSQAETGIERFIKYRIELTAK